jgi:hypothetical protein
MRRWLPVSGALVVGGTAVALAFFVNSNQVLVASDAGHPGRWRLAVETDWAWTLWGTTLAVLLLLVGRAVVRRAILREARVGGRYLALGAAVALGLVATALSPPGSLHQMGCDGSVPLWMMPDDYDGSGCIPYPRNWEETLPWDDEPTYCLGLCGSDALLPEPAPDGR